MRRHPLPNPLPQAGEGAHLPWRSIVVVVSALALGAADGALFDHRVDLRFGVAELAQHLLGVLAELRRQAAPECGRAIK